MKRVILRKLKLEDAELMLDWMLNSEIYRKMQYKYNDIDVNTCISFIEKSWRDLQNIHLAISNRKNEYMGTVSLKNIDNKNRNAELAIVVHPIYWGKGIASDALQELVKKAFFELGLEMIYLYVRSDNERAVEFYKKHQMTFVKYEKNFLLVDGDYKDVLWFLLRKSNYNEWEKQFCKKF